MKKYNGKVITLRINSRNVMRIYDTALKMGLDVGHYTFPAAVSRVLDSLLTELESTEQIPNRGGYEYGEIVEAFRDGRQNSAIPIDADVKVPKVPKPRPIPVTFAEAAPEAADAVVRWRELMDLKVTKPTEWTEALEEELNQLFMEMNQ